VKTGPSGDTHCDIVGDLYKPKSASASHRAPAILTTNGFGGSKDDQADIARLEASRGYVVLSYSGLGFGGSGCKITLDDPDWDGKAARQLVDYLAGLRPDTSGHLLDMIRLDGPGDPRVGMIGGSYGGQVQFAVAGIDHRVDALIPLITWNDLGYSLAPDNGGTGPGVHKKEWTSLFFAEGIVDGLAGAQYDPSRLAGCPNFTERACAAKAELDLLGYPTADTTALARHASVASYAARITAPTLLVQGQADTLFNLSEAAATYRALAANGTTVRMIWQSWGHSNGTPAPGELDLSANGLDQTYLGQRFLSWFEHYLKDRPVGTGPQFAYFRDWVPYTGNASAAYASADLYPVGTAQPLYLSGSGDSGSGDLVTSAGALRPGSQSYANAPGGTPTSYSETSAVQGSLVPDPLTEPTDAPGTFAAWSTPLLTADAVAVGAPTLDVRLDCPAAALTQAAGPSGQLVLFAKLYDVAPDGSVTLPERIVSPVRVADVTQPVHIQLPGIVKRWPAGHRIRLVLAASDAAYAGNTAVLPVTVRADPRAPAVLRLPVIGPPLRT
jgi:predicted acyl esterase